MLSALPRTAVLRRPTLVPTRAAAAALPDRTAALQAAIAAAGPGGAVTLPPGQYAIGGQVTLNNIELIGSGPANDSLTAPGASGTTIVLTNPAVSPFRVQQSVAMRDFNLWCSGQDGSQTAPIAWAPLVTDDGASPTSNLILENVNCPNAYDFVAQSGKTPVWGNILLVGCSVYSIRRFLSLTNVQERFGVVDCLSNPSLYEVVTLQPAHPLLSWTLANGAWLYIFGTGANGAGDPVQAGGLLIVNQTVVDYRRAIHVDTGYLDECQIQNSDFNECPTILEVTPNGTITRTAIDGRFYPFGLPQGVNSTAAFLLDNPAASAIGGSDVRIRGDIAGGDGNAVQIVGPNINDVEVQLQAINYGLACNVGDPSFGVSCDAPNARLRVVGGCFKPGTLQPNSAGVAIANARAAVVSGNIFDGCGLPVAIGPVGSTAPAPVAISGNASVNTQGPRSWTPAGSNIVYIGNAWDKP